MGFLRRWREDRPARRNRAQAKTCFYCGVAFGGDGTTARTIDHRLPRSRGGSDRLVNLVFACRACNDRKADGAEADVLTSAWLRARQDEQAGPCDDPTVRP